MLNITRENVVEVQDWDRLVTETYKRPYAFQQQDGCKSRGIFRFSVPDDDPVGEDFENDTVEEKVNGNEMGVSFKAWLERDPKKSINGETGYNIGLWWDRNFYPDIQMVANDLHSKGLLDAGDYTIDIDW